ncbi:MAG: 50S ribosomal protein L32e [Thermoplasmata archaeon]|nr:50S ribosomal protein L32e [Thermoplasmata archaeon]
MRQASSPASKEAKPKAETNVPKAPARPTLDPNVRAVLRLRREASRRRPLFVRTASHRYWRIGRWESWRRPRGLQSKQRRHYGYRPVVVSIGYGSPKLVRGLTPSGFRPVIVRNLSDLEGLDAATQAAIIARTVGTRKRLALEEKARKLGVHVLNPIVTGNKEE